MTVGRALGPRCGTPTIRRTNVGAGRFTRTLRQALAAPTRSTMCRAATRASAARSDPETGELTTAHPYDGDNVFRNHKKDATNKRQLQYRTLPEQGIR